MNFLVPGENCIFWVLNNKISYDLKKLKALKRSAKHQKNYLVGFRNCFADNVPCHTLNFKIFYTNWWKVPVNWWHFWRKKHLKNITLHSVVWNCYFLFAYCSTIFLCYNVAIPKYYKTYLDEPGIMWPLRFLCQVSYGQ